MHNLKEIRSKITSFKEKISKRNVDINIEDLLTLDKENRELIQSKEKLEQEKKKLSKTKDSKNFDKSKKLSLSIFVVELV